MENNKKNKKPLKLSSTGRLQIRKNLGPSSSSNKNQGSKKTIQIVFRNKNNQQRSSSTAQSNYRGSSSFRTSPAKNFTPTSFVPKTNKNFQAKNKKNSENKKTPAKRSTLKAKDQDDKLDINKILEREEQEFDKFPSLAKFIEMILSVLND